MRRPRVAGALLAAVSLLAAAAPAPAQVRPLPSRAQTSPTRQDVAALRERIAAAEEVDVAERDALLARCDAALEDVEAEARHLAGAAQFDQLAAEAPAQLAALEAELARAPADVEVLAPEGATVGTLEDLQRQAQAQLGAARDNLQELEREVTLRAERRAALTEELARARIPIQERIEELAAAAPPETVAGEVRQLELRAELAAMRAASRAQEAELRSYDERAALLPKRRQRAQRRVSELESAVQRWASLVAAGRDAELQRAREGAARLAQEAAAQHPLLREVVDDTAALLAREQGEDGLMAMLSEYQGRRRRAEQQLARLETSYERTQQKLRVAGLSDAMGRVLREQYEGIPDASELATESRRVRKLLGELQFDGIVISERLLHEGDVEARLAELLDAARAGDPGVDTEAFRAAALAALTQRAQAMIRVSELLASCEQTVEGLVSVQRALVELSARYREFVERHILYVRSVEGGRLPRPGDALDAAVWLVAGPDWPLALRLAWEDATADPLIPVLLLLALAVLIGARRRIAAALDELGTLAHRFRTDSFALTARATLLTLLHALPVPILLWGIGWSLGRPEVTVAGTGEIATGVRALAISLLPLMVVVSTYRGGGLAEAHFRWSDRSVGAVRRELAWFAPIFAVGLGLAHVFRGHGEERFEASLGRLGFVVAALAVAHATRRLVRRDGAVLGEVLGREKALLWRTHGAWSFALVTLPLGLAVTSLFGYHYTALRFADTYRATLDFVLVLVLARALASRWQFLARRRLAVEQARQRLRARAEETVGEAGAPAFDEERVDIPAVDAQTRRLFNGITALGLLAGLYLIWSGIVPALAALERVELWPRLRVVEEAAETVPDPAAGTAAAAPEEAAAEPTLPPLPGMGRAEPRPAEPGAGATIVTLADVIVALLVLAVTSLLAKNVPGLLEIGVLQRLPLDAGARYGVTGILRYAIVLAGLSAVLGAVGIGWSTVQWLAAALTFGLAFGLQEIFANFVSGVILLIERPIRLGDVVIVDGVEGKVSRIRMRATTITDWNRRELLVPNKQFITTSIVNLTLSDPVTRLVVPVGIAYGSDVRLARNTLLEVAARCRDVLEDPEPSVVFRSFGDSALVLELRAFIPSFEVWLPVMNDLHLGIDDAFREKGIEISFPQRDLHLRSIDEGVRSALAGERAEEPRTRTEEPHA